MQKMTEIGYIDYDKSDPAGNSPDYFFNPTTKQVFIDFINGIK